MNQLSAMRAFRCIVEAKGFSAAAERLDTTHSTISRQLQQLEVALGVQLINRNTRRFSLTSPGEHYFAACVDILDRLDAAALALAQGHQQPKGLLRVSVPLVVGTLDLPHWLPGFQKRYPDIELELCCDDQFVDLVAEGFDVAIRIASGLADTTLVARTLTVSKLVLVASPAYVNSHGLPRTAQELDGHRLLSVYRRLIRLGAEPAAWCAGQDHANGAIQHQHPQRLARRCTGRRRHCVFYPGHRAR